MFKAEPETTNENEEHRARNTRREERDATERRAAPRRIATFTSIIEGPLLDALIRDAPTLSRCSRQKTLAILYIRYVQNADAAANLHASVFHYEIHFYSP